MEKNSSLVQLRIPAQELLSESMEDSASIHRQKSVNPRFTDPWISVTISYSENVNSCAASP